MPLLDSPGGAGNVWAVLAAAGSGERLGLDRPKAFAPLSGRPLLAESTVLVNEPPFKTVLGYGLLRDETGREMHKSWGNAIEFDEGAEKMAVPGGTTRAESVRIGVGEVAEDAAVILVHDAARPLLPGEVVDSVLVPLNEGWDGAVPGLPLVDTVKRVRDGAVEETLPRQELVAVQTPQAFLAPVFREAVAGSADDATDCSSLVEARGGRVTVVAGDPRLLKVTTTEDLALVEGWLAGERS